ncbi:WD40 repeat domain-containing protein [Sphingobacterium hungaricum]
MYKQIIGHTDAIKSVAFSPNGQYIVSGSIDKSTKVWSFANKKVIRTLSGHKEGVNKVKFSKSNTYVISAGYDDKMLIWDWMNDKIVKELDIKHTDFSINDQDILAYIDPSCLLTLFDLKSMQELRIIGKFCGSPVFNPSKNIIAVEDSSFSFIDLNANKVLSTLTMLEENSALGISAFKFTPDGQYLAAGILGGEIEIWDWQKGELVTSMLGNNLSSVDDLSFNNKNQLISASANGSLKFWNWNTGELEKIVGDGLFRLKLYGFETVT